MKVLAAAAMSISLLDPCLPRLPSPSRRIVGLLHLPPRRWSSRSTDRARLCRVLPRISPERCASIPSFRPASRRVRPALTSRSRRAPAQPGRRIRWSNPRRHGGRRSRAALGRGSRGDPAGRRSVDSARPEALHGAAPTTSMTHIAVQERVGGSSVYWQEKVTDEQYGQAPAARVMATSSPAAAPGQPTPAQRMFGDIAPKLADLTDNVLFADVWARPELSPRDRSLITVSALIAMNRPDQLRSHMGRARDNGVSKRDRGDDYASRVLRRLAERGDCRGCRQRRICSEVDRPPTAGTYKKMNVLCLQSMLASILPLDLGLVGPPAFAWTRDAIIWMRRLSLAGGARAVVAGAIVFA